MTNIEKMQRDALLQHIIEQIRCLPITPADAMVLLSAISDTLIRQLLDMQVMRAIDDPRFLACELIDACADQIGNLERVAT